MTKKCIEKFNIQIRYVSIVDTHGLKLKPVTKIHPKNFKCLVDPLKLTTKNCVNIIVRV